MKQIIIPLSIVFGIALIAFIYFSVVVIKGKNNLQSLPTSINDSQKVLTKTPAFNLNDYNNQTCTLNTEKITGNIKIKDQNTSSILTYKSNSKTYNTIISDNTLYTWEEGTSNGAKMIKDKTKPALEKEFTNALKPFFDAKSVDCSSTQILDAEFIPPSEINFIDINSLIK